MPWQQKTLLPPLPSEAQGIVDGLDAVAGSIVPILDAAATLLDAAKIFFSAGTDLYATLMTALITEVEDLVNDLFGAGAFELLVHSDAVLSTKLKKDKSGIKLITPVDAVNIAIQSFDDLGDDQRPQFSDGASVSGFGFLVTAKDVFLLIKILEILASVLGLPQIGKIFDDMKEATGQSRTILSNKTVIGDKIQFDYEGGTPEVAKFVQQGAISTVIVASTDTTIEIDNIGLATKFEDGAARFLSQPRFSTGADWDSFTFNQFGAMGDIQTQLLNVLQLSKGYAVVPDNNITELIDLLSRKVDTLTAAVTIFQAVIDEIINTAGLADAWVWDLPLTTGGNTKIKESLVNPTFDSPSFALNRYTFFAVYVGGGPAATNVDLIRALFA